MELRTLLLRHEARVAVLGVVNTASSGTPVSYDNKFVILAANCFKSRTCHLHLGCDFHKYHLLYSHGVFV
jgi:hypothetical protein